MHERQAQKDTAVKTVAGGRPGTGVAEAGAVIAVSGTETVPLSAEEEAAWTWAVEEGRKIRAPVLARQAARRERINAHYRAAGCKNDVLKGETKDAMSEAPVRCRRWVVLRLAGLTFRKAAAASGATWLDIQDAKYHNEAFRCAVAAMEEGSRQLMRAKAQSVVEQSQEEDAKVSLAQTQVSLRILERLDREHFGERTDEDDAAEETGRRRVGDGGFVINIVGDAARAASVPARAPARALVYTEV